MKIVVVSGGFDPIHSGHIAYFVNAKDYGNKLIVALNSDQWLIDKKGKFFMPFSERKTIIENLSVVDKVIDFEDDNYGSASNALEKIKKLFPKDEIIFANGGDRSDTSKILEYDTAQEFNIELKFGIGGNHKESSSSDLLGRWEEYIKNKTKD